MPTSVDPLTRPGYDSVAVKFGCWLWSIKVDRIFSVDRMLAFFFSRFVVWTKCYRCFVASESVKYGTGKTPSPYVRLKEKHEGRFEISRHMRRETEPQL